MFLQRRRSRVSDTAPSGRIHQSALFSAEVRAAAITGLIVVGLGVLILSPLMRVQTIVWTGQVGVSEVDCARLEGRTLGMPLFLLGERALREMVGVDPQAYRFGLRRHAPNTLEISLQPREAIARLDAKTVVDASGRILRTSATYGNLPVLHGLPWSDQAASLDATGRRFVRALHTLLSSSALSPSEARFQDPEWELRLRDSGARVRLLQTQLESHLTKLRVFEQSLGSTPMPEEVDLRFRNQVIVGAHQRVGRRVDG